MNKINIYRSMLIFLTIFLIGTAQLSFSQQEVIDKDQYQIGADERLLITVHIFGEVKQTGEFLVPDDTNVLELISKAGGPTEYSNLNNIKITRGLTSPFDQSDSLIEKRVLKVNLKKILNKENFKDDLPILQPGDVIRVGRNTWFTWQTIIRVASQLAIIAQVWYWYDRAQ